MTKPALLTSGTVPVTIAEIARHLSVSRTIAIDILRNHQCRKLPGNRYDLTDIWYRFWRVRSVPLMYLEAMAQPLLTVAEVAERAGVTEHTIRRAGNSRNPRWNLPPHVDLGPRCRRYLPLHIEYWLRSEPLPHWLEPQAGPISGSLRPRSKTVLSQLTGAIVSN